MEPRNLRLLRRLVTVLMMVMIGGVVLIIALLVIRLNDRPLDLPEAIELPAGARPASFTQGRDWVAVITEDDQVLVFDRLSGALKQTLKIDMESQ